MQTNPEKPKETVVLLTTNCLVFRNVNANSQFLLWKGLRILNESKLNLIDCDFYRKPANYFKFLFLNYVRRNRVRIEGKTLWVIDEWSVNYYHWLVDSLPRLVSTRQDLGQFTVVLPSDYKRLGYHARTLDMLGVRYRYFDVVSERIYCEELHLPLYVSITGTTNALYAGKVRDRLLARVSADQSPQGGKHRIYVTRRKAPKRRIINETEVIRLLEALDFHVVEFENLAFDQQAALCRDATILIGLHGAGLTNMMFMQPDSLVLELGRQNERNFCFQELAAAFRLRYHRLECKIEGTDALDSDFYVNLPEFEHLLKTVL